MQQLADHFCGEAIEGESSELSGCDVHDAVLHLLVHLALARDASSRARACADDQVSRLVQRAAMQQSAAAAAVRNVFASMAAGAAVLSAATVSNWPSQRHANDVTDFRRVEVVPIAEEIRKDAHAYLPMADGSDQFLQWNPLARGLDRAFRLFREDQVSDVRAAMHNAYAVKPDGPRPCVFANAAVAGIDADAPLPCVLLEFDLPERVRKLRTLAERVCATLCPRVPCLMSSFC